MSDFIFTDEESLAKAETANSLSAPAKKKRAPAKKKAVSSAPLRSAPSRSYPSKSSSSASSAASSSNSTAWLLIFICLLAVAGYFAYQYYSLRIADSGPSAAGSEVATLETSTPDTAATETETDPAASWLPYAYSLPMAANSTSTASGTLMFSLKYPPTSIINKTDKRIVFDVKGVTSTSFIVAWEKSTLDLTAYLKNLDKISAKSWEGKPAVQVVTSTEAKMDDKYPVILRQQKMLAADLNQYIAYIKASSTIYSVALIAPVLTDSETAAFSIFLNNFIIN